MGCCESSPQGATGAGTCAELVTIDRKETLAESSREEMDITGPLIEEPEVNISVSVEQKVAGHHAVEQAAIEVDPVASKSQTILVPAEEQFAQSAEQQD